MSSGKVWLYTYSLNEKDYSDIPRTECVPFLIPTADGPISGPGITTTKTNGSEPVWGTCTLRFKGLTAHARLDAFADIGIFPIKQESYFSNIKLNFNGKYCYATCEVDEKFKEFIRTFRIYTTLDKNLNPFMPNKYVLPKNYREICKPYIDLEKFDKMVTESGDKIGEHIECEIFNLKLK